MTKIRDIDRQAADWVAWLDSGEQTRRLEFESWLAANPRHRAAFRDTYRCWKMADCLAALRGREDLFGAQATSHIPLGSGATWWPRSAIGLSRAALVAVVVLAIGLWWLSYARPEWEIYETRRGESARVTLEDESTVDLNTATLLRARFSLGKREVALVRGEALFAVAQDARRPFHVFTPNARIRALGTIFNVRVDDPKHVTVLVTEGRVAIAPRAQDGSPGEATGSRTLFAGDSAVIEGNRVNQGKVTPELMARKLSWTTGMLSFGDTTLARAVEELNRYNELQIQVGDPSIADIDIGGQFKPTDPDSFIKAIQRFGVQPVYSPQEPNKVVLISSASVEARE